MKTLSLLEVILTGIFVVISMVSTIIALFDLRLWAILFYGFAWLMSYNMFRISVNEHRTDYGSK